MILNDSRDSFYFRLAASSLVAISFVEGRQITQEDDVTISCTAGFLSLSAFAMSLANIHHLAKGVVHNPRINCSNIKNILRILMLSCFLIRIASLRTHFFNPTDYLDRDHPMVWKYLSYCGTTLTLSAYLD